MQALFLKFGFINFIFFESKVITKKKQDMLELSSAFSDRMVPKRKNKSSFWRKSKPDDVITVNFSQQKLKL